MSLPWKDRRLVITGSAALVLLLAGAVFYFLPRPAQEAAPVEETPPEAETQAPEVRAFRLYFPGGDGRLHAVARELALSSDANENVASLVEALLAGPHGEHAAEAEGADGTDAGNAAPEAPDGLWPPFPAGVSLGASYLMSDATVILDLVSPDGSPPSAGSKMEMLMLYSLVNTVLSNVGEAKRVVVLWNGRQPSTFAGHVDATHPFVASNELVAAGGAS